MITIDNLKQMLFTLGYEEDGNILSYHFKDFDCDITVNFNTKKIYYPENKGLIINERQTCNLSDNENFVVLECIHRLLLKGYKPEHIEIEKRWSLGHSQKSGRADICVMNETGNDMLAIIECKTYGIEFDQELNNLKNDGSQLFSYYQQEKATKWLILYSANFKDEKIDHQVSTIPVFDTEEILKKSLKDKSIKLYEQANSKDNAFNVWVETYEKKMYRDLIFSDDTIAYNIGEKPLRKKDLKEFDPRDKIVNQFEEILRHNNVSDKENAFNKLVALFICKLVDEITKEENDIVDFQYKFGTDTYETLLDRLQRLYKEGMDKFMKEEIFYVSSEYPLTLFSKYKGNNRKNAINDLKETFRKLKYFSNSDFAFKDVHNEELFLQNGKILVEVVKLFENYRIVYSSKHQFLGDLFEQLLNQGFKQNEGQFFTPMPITRFIWESLPLESIIKKLNGDKYPKIIDFACGSGHFLTEGIETINELTSNTNNDWVNNKIYGIEKDYRLARVSKISLFMNGAGGGNIIFGDGLDNYEDKEIKNNNFDILVANPPYSVKAFKSHLKLEHNDFELLELISNDGSEIEVLFIERIAQLVKGDGIAAVILPSSILSNSSASYTEARGVLLKNFKIVAITQFADKTFGATGTNTIVLFLQKYIEPPKFFEIIEDNVEAIFNDNKEDDWLDNEILNEYIRHIHVDKSLYQYFIKEIYDYKDFSDDDYFKMYVDEFNNSTELKKIRKQVTFKKLDDMEQKERLNTLFYSNVKSIEREKIFYFALVREQKTLIIKSPTKNKEQNEFLGYQWSNRKGNEGIQINKLGGQLYNPSDRNSKEHIAPIIRKHFNEINLDIPTSIENFVSIMCTKDMLDFNRDKFDKAINLIAKKEYVLESKYKTELLGEICSIVIGGTPSRKNIEYFKGNNLWVSISDMQNSIIYETKEKITEKAIKNSNVKLIPKGTTLLSFKLSIGKTSIAGKDLYTNEAIAGLIPVDDRIINKFLFYIFKSGVINLSNLVGNKAFGKSLNSTFLKTEVKIPVPPTDIQEKIIEECSKIEQKYEMTRMKIKEYQKQIQNIFYELEVTKNNEYLYKLGEFCSIISGGTPSTKEKNYYLNGDIPWLKSEVCKGEIINKSNTYITQEGLNNSNAKWLEKDTTLMALVGATKGKVGFLTFKATTNQNIAGIKVINNKIANDKYLFYLLRSKYEEIISNLFGYDILNLTSIRNIKVPLIDIEEQNRILNKVELLEKEIEKLLEEQVDINQEISNIINKYIL